MTKIKLPSATSKIKAGSRSTMKSFTLAVALLVAVSADATILLCREGRFQCENKAACVPHEYVCDGRNDCLDRSDETDCSNGRQCKLRNCSSICNVNPYNNGIFCSCPTGYELADDQRTCEDINECGTSPSLCSQNCTNTPGSFECSCFAGFVENTDGSCRSNISGEASSPKLVCTSGKHACENGESCISMDFVCDNSVDCGDGSDETNCEKGKLCKMKQCQQTCVDETLSPHRSYMYIHSAYPTPIEPTIRCTCKEGYKLGIDEKTCDDINECALGTHNCSQRCINQDGTFQCACAEGYYLDQKSHVCKASGVFPLLFLAKPHSVQIHNLVKNKTYHLNMRNAINGNLEKAVYSPSNKRIIILESFPEGGRILISDRSRVLKTLSLDYPFSGPEDLEIDWRTNNIYITDPSKGVIVACRLDNLTCSVVVQETLSRPTRIVLDPIAGKMYWSDQGVNTGIFSSNMDGEKIEPLVTKDVYKPNAIALDKPTESVFWSDARGTTYRVHGISLADNRIWTVLSTPTRQFVLNSPINDLAVFEDTVYFSTFSSVVFSFPKLNTSVVPIPKPHVETDRLEPISSFSIYQPLLMPYEIFSNPCNKINCTEMCLLSSENGFSCHDFVKIEAVKHAATVDNDRHAATVDNDRHATTQRPQSITSFFEEVDKELETDAV